MNDFPAAVDLADRLGHALRSRGWMLATAESCTGGLVAAACTELAGSSDWFERGFVTYANAAKAQALGVPQALLQAHGAVSEPVARAMAAGAAAAAGVATALAITGVAGPAGGSADKPVGLVWFAWSVAGSVSSEAVQFPGARAQVRGAAACHALRGLLMRLPPVAGAAEQEGPGRE